MLQFWIFLQGHFVPEQIIYPGRILKPSVSAFITPKEKDQGRGTTIQI